MSSSLDYSKFDRIVADDEPAALLEKPTRMDYGEGDDLLPLDESWADEEELKLCRGLPQNSKEVWQVAALKLRCWVGAMGDDEAESAAASRAPTPVRPYTLFIGCVHPTGRLLTRHVCRPPEQYPSPREAVAQLVRCMVDPPTTGAGHEAARRPGIVTFTDPALAGHCARTLARIGVQTSVLSPSPGLLGTVRSLSSVLIQKDVATVSPAGDQEALCSVRSLTPQLLRGFYRLARAFAAAEPWRRFSERQTLRLWRSDGRAVPADTLSQAIPALPADGGFDSTAPGAGAGAAATSASAGSDVSATDGSGPVAWVAVMGELSAAAAAQRAARKEARLARKGAAVLRQERRAARAAAKAAAKASAKAAVKEAVESAAVAASAASASADGFDARPRDRGSSFASCKSNESGASAERDEGDSDKEGREADAAAAVDEMRSLSSGSDNDDEGADGSGGAAGEKKAKSKSGDSAKKGADGEEDDDDDDEPEVAQTRGICVFFNRYDAEQRLLAPSTAPAPAAAAGAGAATPAATTPAAALHPLDAHCAQCGKRGPEYTGAAASSADGSITRSLDRAREVLRLPEDAAAAAQLHQLFAPTAAAGGPSASAPGACLSRLQRCARCKRVAYCGVDCQRAHWPSHSASCKTNAVPAPAAGQRYWGGLELVLLLESAPSLPFDDLDWYDAERLAARRERQMAAAAAFAAVVAGGDAASASAGGAGASTSSSKPVRVPVPDMMPEDAFYPDDLPLPLAFRKGTAVRPGARELAWLMRGMAAVLRLTEVPRAEAAAPAAGETAAAAAAAAGTSAPAPAPASSRACLAPAGLILKPSLRPVDLDTGHVGFDNLKDAAAAAEAAGKGTRAPEPWYVAAGEGRIGQPPKLHALLDPMLPAAPPAAGK